MSQPKKNYYEILEISSDATDEEITKAYRKLAVKWHPDKHKGEEKKKIAEEKFKEISEANSVLSDPEKRSQYDQFGLCDGEQPEFSGPQGFPDLSEIFGSMGGMGGIPGMGGFPFMGGMGGMGGIPGMNMGGMGGIPGMGGMGGMGGMNGMGGNVQRNNKPSQEFKVKLRVNELYEGCEKTIEIPIDDICGDCNGTGSKNKKKKICPDCKGKGIRVVMRQLGPGMISQQQTACGTCQQKCWVSEGNCAGCQGKCTKPNKLTKKISIKKNFDYQTKMCLRDAGNYDANIEKKADIYIVFKITDLEDYNLKITNEYDLVFDYSIHLWDALSGHTMYIGTHPSGKKYSFKIAEIIKDGDVRFAKGLGLPNEDGSPGKFIIKFNYKYPESVLEHDKLKDFFRTKEENKGIVKSEYSKEKLFNPETEKDEEHNFKGKRGNKSNKSNGYDDDNGDGGDGDGQPGVQCAQS